MRNKMHKVTLTQEECLNPTSVDNTSGRIPLVTTFNPYTTYIAEIANRHWDLLQSKERLAKIFYQLPLVVYRKPRSIRNKLVRTKFSRIRETNREHYCKPCNKPRCIWCKYVNTTGTFKGTHVEKE